MKTLKLLTLLGGLLFLSPMSSADVQYKTETMVEGLDHPWSMAFISSRHMLVTELPGQLRLVTDGELSETPIEGVPEVLFAGQGGLSEVLVHPNFEENGFIYLSFSAPDADEPKLNRLNVVRARLEGEALVGHKTIFKSNPPRKAAAH
jgi:glucose/arabinose dehydrogenase